MNTISRRTMDAAIVRMQAATTALFYLWDCLDAAENLLGMDIGQEDLQEAVGLSGLDTEEWRTFLQTLADERDGGDT